MLRYRSLAGPSTKLIVAVKVNDVPGTARDGVHVACAARPSRPRRPSRSWDRFIQSPLTLIGILLLIVSMIGYTVFRLVYRPHDVLTRRIGQFVTLPEAERAQMREDELATLAAEETRPKERLVRTPRERHDDRRDHHASRAP